MGEYLAQQGYSVMGVRLAGHATRMEDMIRSRYTDWIASVEDGYHILSAAADRIFLLGLSMGGVLALLMATRLEAAGVVAMCTPFQMPIDAPIPLPVVRLFSRIVPYFRKGKEPGEGWFDRQAFKQHVEYPRYPVRAGVELKLLLAEMRRALPQVTVPVLLIHSRDDGPVLQDSMNKIAAQLGTQDKQLIWITGSGHVITEEPQHQRVFEAAADFIRRIDGYSRRDSKTAVK